MRKLSKAERFVRSKCDRCGRATPARQNDIGDLFTLPESFGPQLRDEGSFCQACIDRYDFADWCHWMRIHRPDVFRPT